MNEAHFALYARRKYSEDTDPLRRFHDSATASAASPPEWILILRAENVQTAEAYQKFWEGINEYAIARRGEIVRMEFKIEQVAWMAGIKL